MDKAIAVLISDVHYNLSTLLLADAAMRMAIGKANELNVPLIVCGDLHDTKANMRGECVNAMLKTFALCETDCYVLRGNHDAINEKSKEHSLNFLNDLVSIVEEPAFNVFLGVHMIPYQHDPNELKEYLKTADRGETLIMHQGVQGSHMGDYIHDKSAITKADLASFRVVSGHYHNRQSFTLPDGGLMDYVGNPFTLTQGEANDPPKGFQVLNSNGTLDFVPTNLRSHRVWECNLALEPRGEYNPGDILTIKVTGTHEELTSITRRKVQEATGIEYFKLDLIPLAAEAAIPEVKPLVQSELLDNLIDSLTNTTDDRKSNLKELWRRLGQ